jgi:hypothetical protein
MKRIVALLAATAVFCASALTSGVAMAQSRKEHVSKNAHVLVQFFGDSVSLTLGIALAAPNIEAKYHYTLRDGGILGCGVVDGTYVIVSGKTDIAAEPCRGTTPPPGTPLVDQPWPVQWQHLLSTRHPNVGVLLAGRWEVVDRLYNGQYTNILNPIFAAYVKQQLELASNIVTSSGANMVFITAPCSDSPPQPDGTPWPENSTARLDAYNQLVEQVAAEHPSTDSVVDLNSAVCPGDQFSSTYKGVTIRQPDGVHFTLGAGSVLASVVMPKILASGRAQLARVAELKAKLSKKHKH